MDDPYNMNDDSGAEPLRVGTFVTASIEGRAGGELFVIPRHSLQRGETLWLVDEDLTIQPRDLTIARSDEEFAYVAAGLEPGERYTVTPPERPLPGMLVRISNASAAVAGVEG